MTDSPKTASKPAAVLEDPVKEIFRQWQLEIISGSVIAQHTPAYNYLVDVALPDLLKRLKKE